MTTSTSLWLAEDGGRGVIAVTGTKGKSTTATLTAHLLGAAGRSVHLAGNVGIPAIELLDRPAAEHVVLELSSYQIADLATGPRVAVFTNLYREHVDWHRGEAGYRRDKLRLASLPGVELVVANAADPGLAELRDDAGERLRTFGDAGGYHVDDRALRRGDELVTAIADLPFPGRHNALNLCAALAALEAVGVPAPALPEALAGFRMLPHRLETVALDDGVAWVNDSISTTPESALAALASYPEHRVILIAGGHDREQDYSALGRELARRGSVVLGLPVTGERLVAAARAAGVTDAELTADLPRRGRRGAPAGALGRRRAALPRGAQLRRLRGLRAARGALPCAGSHRLDDRQRASFDTVGDMLETTLAAVSVDSVRQACGDSPGWVCRSVLNWTGQRTLAELADFIIGKPLTILAIVIGALIVNRLARRGMKSALQTLRSGAVQERLGSMRASTPAALLHTHEHSLRAEQRIDALTSVLRSLVSVVVYAIAVFMILGEVGINLGPLLAGAGIIGVALGFGSQSLVRDFLSGVFILIEDQFGVGDVVDLDGQTAGVVEAVSLRTTRLRGVDGTLWHVPNGEIRRVGNQSQHWSRALIDVEVAYDTDVEHAEAVIGAVAGDLASEDGAVLDDPEVWGVERLGAHGVGLRLVVKTRPSEHFRIARELRRRIKAAFDREGIEIPLPQQTVWHRGAPVGRP